MDFPTLQDFIVWYNNRPHGSHNMQTPEQEYSGKEHKHTYSEVFSNGQKNNKAQYLPDNTIQKNIIRNTTSKNLILCIPNKPP